MEITSKFISSYFNYFQLTFSRFFLGLILFLFFLMMDKNKKIEIKRIKIKEFMQISSLGFINIFLSMTLLQYSVEKGSASISAVLIGAHPIFVYLLNYLFDRKSSIIDLLRIFVGISGISILILPTFDTNDNMLTLPIIAGLFSSFLFATYTFLSKKLLNDYSPFLLNLISFFMGILFLFPLLFLKNSLYFSNLNLKNIFLILYLGFIVTGLGYFFYYQGFKRINVVDGSVLFFLKPLLATILSKILLNENLKFIQYVGIVLIIFSLLKIDKGFKNVYSLKFKKNNTC